MYRLMCLINIIMCVCTCLQELLQFYAPMCIRIYAILYLPIFTIHSHTYTNKKNTHKHFLAHTNFCAYTHTHARAYVHACTCTYTHAVIYAHICTYAHTCTHTNTETQHTHIAHAHMHTHIMFTNALAHTHYVINNHSHIMT